MAIDQVKTINELERLPQVEDSNAFAASTGGATGSVTANQIMEYMKQYLESLSNKSTTLTKSDSQYPTCNAVSKETTRIINIMNSKTGLSAGYYKFPSGLILQWGVYSQLIPKGNLTATVTLPVAYSSNFVVVVARRNNIDTDSYEQFLHWFVDNLSQFKFGADNYRNDYKGFFWLTVGY